MFRVRVVVSFKVSVSIVVYRKGHCGKSKEFSEKCYCRLFEVVTQDLKRSIVSGGIFQRSRVCTL